MVLVHCLRLSLRYFRSCLTCSGDLFLISSFRSFEINFLIYRIQPNCFRIHIELIVSREQSKESKTQQRRTQSCSQEWRNYLRAILNGNGTSFFENVPFWIKTGIRQLESQKQRETQGETKKHQQQSGLDNCSF